MVIKAFSGLYDNGTPLFEYHSDLIPRKGDLLSIQEEDVLEFYEVKQILRGLNIAPSLDALREDAVAVVVREMVD